MRLSNRRTAAQFPGWSMAQCKAYSQGAWAGRGETPFEEGFEEDCGEDDLRPFFARGYADAIGSAAEGEEWFDEISDWRICYRWWESL